MPAMETLETYYQSNLEQNLVRKKENKFSSKFPETHKSPETIGNLWRFFAQIFEGLSQNARGHRLSSESEIIAKAIMSSATGSYYKTINEYLLIIEHLVVSYDGPSYNKLICAGF
jgi:hypothetical protein